MTLRLIPFLLIIGWIASCSSGGSTQYRLQYLDSKDIGVEEMPPGYKKGDTIVIYAIRGHAVRAVVLDTLATIPKKK